MAKFTTAQELIDGVNRGVTEADLNLPDDVKNNPALNLAEIQKLAEFLKEDKALKKLSLGRNNMDADGAAAIADSLKVNTTLEILNLRNNNIGDTGASDIATALKKNKGLKNIHLMYNSIEVVGASDIATALKENKTLNTLNIQNNNIGDAGALAFADAITINRTIDHVFIPAKEIGATAQKAFSDACEINLMIADVAKDYSKSILVPQLIKAIYIDGSLPQHANKELSLDDYNELQKQTKKYLFAGLNGEQLVKFSEHWHQPLQQTNSQKLKDYNGLSWEPLLGTKEIAVPEEGGMPSGWKIIAINTPQELKNEGTALNHCVGGYSGQCITGNSHILSVVDPNGKPQSTIEIQTDYNSQTYQVIQHYGVKNATPPESSPSAKALEWLKGQLDTKKLNIDYEGLEHARTERLQTSETLQEKTMLEIGFDPLNARKCTEISTLYSVGMLPPHKDELELRRLLKANLKRLQSLSCSLSEDGKLSFAEPRELTWQEKVQAKHTQPNTGKANKDDLLAIKENVATLFDVDKKNVRVDQADGKLSISLPDDGMNGQARLKEIFGNDVTLQPKGNYVILTTNEQTFQIRKKLDTALQNEGKVVETDHASCIISNSQTSVMR